MSRSFPVTIITPTQTPTNTPTNTNTATPTQTPTNTSTTTQTPTNTPTTTPTQTPNECCNLMYFYGDPGSSSMSGLTGYYSLYMEGSTSKVLSGNTPFTVVCNQSVGGKNYSWWAEIGGGTQIFWNVNTNAWNTYGGGDLEQCNDTRSGALVVKSLANYTEIERCGLTYPSDGLNYTITYLYCPTPTPTPSITASQTQTTTPTNTPTQTKTLTPPRS